MARGPRNYINMPFYHIMVQGINKEYIFNKVEDKRQYLKFINKAKDETDIYIVSYCIMDNHVHILVKEKSIEDLSRFMHKINTLYAIYYNKKYNRVGYVFRDRYKSQVIYSEKQLYTCINYIHNNPVKAGICKLASEYEYSSYNEYMKNMEEIQRNINGLLIKENIADKKENFLEIEEDLINDVIKCQASVKSLDEVIMEDGKKLTLLDKIADHYSDSEQYLESISLQEGLKSLTNEEYELINLRYFEDKTQSEIAKFFGTNQVQISRNEKKILKKLKNNLCKPL